MVGCPPPPPLVPLLTTSRPDPPRDITKSSPQHSKLPGTWHPRPIFSDMATLPYLVSSPEGSHGDQQAIGMAKLYALELKRRLDLVDMDVGQEPYSGVGDAASLP